MQPSPDRQTASAQQAHIPTVTIGMPVYNGEQYIREALDSVLTQTFTDFELTISDNASTDNTEAICREYAGKDVRIKYIRQPGNIGGFNNFNYLLEHARGNYFTWLAHDDYLDASFLEVIVLYLDEHDDVVLCSGDFAVVNGANVPQRTIALDEVRDHKEWTNARRNFFTYSTNITVLIYGVYRLSIMRAYNLSPQPGLMGMGLGCEYSILTKLAMLGRIVALPHVLRTYRIHDGGAAHQEGIHTRPLLRLLNIIYVILKYQARPVVFSKLTIREKMDIFLKMLSYDMPLILGLISGLCIPKPCRRLLSRIKWLRKLRDRMRK